MELVKDFYGKKGLTKAQLEIRYIALNNFEAYIRLVAPYELLGHCHITLAKWLQDLDNENRLLLWPRDHKKSRTCAFYAAWTIIRDPSTTIIYASATAEKAEEQLRFIKDIISSEISMRYFPGLLHPEEGRREAWNKTFVIVDHPMRKHEGVVDSTIMTCGLDKTITGKHCKKLILDDIVVPENNTELGRRDVNKWAAQAAAIMSAESSMLVAGTRYHPKDAYQIMMDMVANVEEEDEDGNIVVKDIPLFEVNIANVESEGDFLWPRSQRKDGKWFGYNPTILAKKRAIFEATGEITQFFAQYYNDPNDKTTAPISRDLFQYYDKEELEYVMGMWTVQGRPCHLFCSVDLAASVSATADYTAVIVGAIDDQGNRYVLDIARYQTTKISTTSDTLVEFFKKYHYKKLRIEAVAGFKLVAMDLAERLKNKGIRIPIDIYTPPNNAGKLARVNGILEPLYQSQAAYHYRGGNCQLLEDELVSVNPLHDDLKDAWAMCCDLMETPIRFAKKVRTSKVIYHPRFGGVQVA